MRRLVASVAVSGLLFSVYTLRGSFSEQVNDAAQAGTTPNRNCTCPVRFDPDFALDAGLGLYQRVTFPCSVRTPDAGLRDVTLPPMPVQRARDAIDVVDWNDCTIAASTAPVAALWGQRIPFTRSGVVKPWCRAKLDAGLPCLRAGLLLDGGIGSYGDRNVYPCSQAFDPATCERVSGGAVYLGDDPEDL